MPNKSYQKGYKLEYDVRKRLENNGYHVMRSGKSRFPDGIACSITGILLPKIFYFECKWNKYISKDEKEKADTIKLKTGIPFLVFYKDEHKIRWYEYGERKDIPNDRKD
jgi:Holliday junction resolvase